MNKVEEIKEKIAELKEELKTLKKVPMYEVVSTKGRKFRCKVRNGTVTFSAGGITHEQARDLVAFLTDNLS